MNARTPEDVDRLFGEYLNAGDVEGIVALYEPGATFVPQDGPPIAGHEQIRAAIAGFAAMKPKIRMHVAKVVAAGDDVAVLYNDWQMTVSGADGKPVEVTGKATEIVRRQSDGSWRFILDDPYMRG